jgi:hypothetical protein
VTWTAGPGGRALRGGGGRAGGGAVRPRARPAGRGSGRRPRGGRPWVCDDGLVIDLSAMTAVRVDPAARTARAQGCLYRHLDHATQAAGLAVTGGIVTSFEYDLHPVGPVVMAGMVAYDLADGPEVLRCFRDLVAQAPDDLGAVANLRLAPPLAEIPAHLHGRPIVSVPSPGSTRTPAPIPTGPPPTTSTSSPPGRPTTPTRRGTGDGFADSGRRSSRMPVGSTSTSCPTSQPGARRLPTGRPSTSGSSC